jgi:hypothetical protein
MNNLDFETGASSFNVRVATSGAGGKIEIRLDSITGFLAGTCSVTSTGGWQNWQTKSCQVNGISGVHNIYLKFTGSSGYLFNLNWFNFVPSTTLTNKITNQTAISVITRNDKKYLKGTKAGDLISIYALSGKKVAAFKSTSDLEWIQSSPGVAFIEVCSGKIHTVVKTQF